MLNVATLSKDIVPEKSAEILSKVCVIGLGKAWRILYLCQGFRCSKWDSDNH